MKKDIDNGEQLNIEIKAHFKNLKCARGILESERADFEGFDHQIDTYYTCREGRLKLREGNIENKLIHYNRTDQEGPKKSQVTLYKTQPPNTLKDVLDKALETLVVVDKEREIYFLGNVKIHLDEVKDLGNFIEFEAMDDTGDKTTDYLQKQCEDLIRLFNIKNEDLISDSYSDMILAQQERK